jgi:CelD/BcsL family acetyltransferase involved in cellulose biosynthesis
MPHSKADEIVLCLHGDLCEIEPEWKAFERHAACTPLQSFDWLTHCHRHLGRPNGASPAIVFGRDRYGQLLFILPLAVVRRGSLRCLTWLGSNVYPCNAPLLAERFCNVASGIRFVRLWAQIVDRLRADRRFRFDWIDLQKTPETIGAQRNPFVGLEGAVQLSEGECDGLPPLDSKLFDYLGAGTMRGRLAVGLIGRLRRTRRFLRRTPVWGAFRAAGLLALSIEWR